MTGCSDIDLLRLKCLHSLVADLIDCCVLHELHGDCWVSYVHGA